MADSEVERLARIVWDYHHMNHALAPADVILVQGSHDLRVAERGAELYLEGFAPLVVMSGGLGNLTQGMWDEPEAIKFARVAREKGVPEGAILDPSGETAKRVSCAVQRSFLAIGVEGGSEIETRFTLGAAYGDRLHKLPIKTPRRTRTTAPRETAPRPRLNSAVDFIVPGSVSATACSRARRPSPMSRRR